MALIKCPECGKEVSDKAEACIHCGCPLKSARTKEGSAKGPKSIGKSWVYKWQDKAKKSRLNLFFNFLATVVFLVISSICLANDQEAVYHEYLEYTSYYPKTIWIVMESIASFFVICSLVLWLCGLFQVKAHVREIDGYSVCVYAGVFKDILIIENKEQDRHGIYMFEAFLYGMLPNEKRIICRQRMGSCLISLNDSTVGIL